MGMGRIIISSIWVFILFLFPLAFICMVYVRLDLTSNEEILPSLFEEGLVAEIMLA